MEQVLYTLVIILLIAFILMTFVFIQCKMENIALNETIDFMADKNNSDDKESISKKAFIMGVAKAFQYKMSSIEEKPFNTNLEFRNWWKENNV